jgi:hypothetical protein
LGAVKTAGKMLGWDWLRRTEVDGADDGQWGEVVEQVLKGTAAAGQVTRTKSIRVQFVQNQT